MHRTQGLPRTPEHLRNVVPDEPGQDLTGVLIKMGVMTAAMIIVPLSSYYLSRDYYFKDNTTGAGIFAATMANVVLGSIIWYALQEDREVTAKKVEKKNK